MLNSKNLFSHNYVEARQRFLKAAQSVNADLTSHSISSRGAQGEELTIDIATLGAKNPETTILLTSGLHGIEGFLGSAIQIAWLEALQANPIAFDKTAVVLVHALNPYGFSWQRRVNESNVDLNRNFILPGQKFQGSPPLLKQIPWLQQPASPDKFFIIEFHMLWTLLHYGMYNMRKVLLSGQCDYPSALFWCGHKHEETSQIVKENISSWTRQSQSVFHIDFHTGLGKYGICYPLIFEPADSPRTIRLKSVFGPSITNLGSGLLVCGNIEGVMVEWIAKHFEAQKKNYTYLVAEYGTLPVFRAFKALYQENRFYNHPGPECASATKELKEVFCPADPVWREKCVTEGLALISKSLSSSKLLLAQSQADCH